MPTVTSGACGANTPQAATMPHVQLYKKPHVRMCKKPDVQMHKIPDVEMYNYIQNWRHNQWTLFHLQITKQFLSGNLPNKFDTLHCEE